MKKHAVKGISEKEMAELLHLPSIQRKLLINRGIKSAGEAVKFLKSDYNTHLHDPFLMKDMDKAVDRIIKAIKNDEVITIWSDYDADGIPGAVIFHDFFKRINYGKARFYIPHRNDEGFGLNVGAMDEVRDYGTNLLISVDCGIVDVDAVDKANELGMEVIITDHHKEQEGRIPKAFAIVNPNQKACGYPFKGLCGAGVVFKIINAILQKDRFDLKEGMEKWFLDLVGIATLSDMVPLVDENRVMAKFGISVLRKTQRKGLLSLFRNAKLDISNINEDDIGFTLSPRINSASRMGEASHAFDLLTADNFSDAEKLAIFLEKINNERKGITASITKHVKKLAKERGVVENGIKVLVMGNPEWKPTLLGPVANNLSDEFNIPVFLWGRSSNDIKGSCRAPDGHNVVALMQGVKQGVFKEFGGHSCSGGFSVHEDQIHFLDEELNKAMESMGELPEVEDDFIDSELNLDEVNEDNWKLIEEVSPFGMDNPKPIFLFKNAEVAGVKSFGKENNHTEILFKNSLGRKIQAISFFIVPADFEKKIGKKINVGDLINLTANMEKSFFRNRPELRLRIIDIF
ncbi:MAG: single-stranded-DNA-specific exonuclease RecJ [bacterium]|nr:single-stranded-DNA-specific exonuclease RecJ [bacterium]